jgi:6-methylsalicylate decarboxylase
MGITRKPRIDFHQHLWPEELIAELRGRRLPPCLGGNVLTTGEGQFEIDLGAHVLERRLAALDALSIERAVISLQPTLGIERLPANEARPLRDAYHEGALRLSRASAGRIVPLAAAAALDGFAGACVAAEALLVPSALAPLLADLAQTRGILFVHPGPAGRLAGSPAWWGPVVGYATQMQTAYAAWLALDAARREGVPVVFAILAGGAPFQLERLASWGVDPRLATSANAYFDTASYGRLALELSLAAYGVTRLVYGSDAPVIDPAPTLGAITALGKAASDAITSDNPLRLLHGDDRAVDRAPAPERARSLAGGARDVRPLARRGPRAMGAARAPRSR